MPHPEQQLLNPSSQRCPQSVMHRPTQLHPHRNLVAQKQKSGFTVDFLGRSLWAGHAGALLG